MYDPHENIMIERTVKKIHQKINEVRNLKKTRDDTNKAIDKYERPNL